MDRMNTDIYKMKLHDIIYLPGEGSIKRVPGGWIYLAITQTSPYGSTVNTCFVPFNNEFMETDKSK